ncbi:lipid A biosynthesis (KDO)2-(lauroyl)-lipid IVA acyltransferase [Prevotella sp. DNF00663]|uniref:lysophospholipid acyltransferase family protein n=1 Tax=Prevotella sp. DNF00663 TaxID=1384078 RepID=UPI0007951073|nr:lysophospholipid acyltransferase family protein [Prevotella sp. DNF00663]KXB84083.1 lipid A biosynthesis (KDO)2-(lauroyl)-lipid IVA acyltransferase [Prevotella sp. DNF00663]
MTRLNCQTTNSASQLQHEEQLGFWRKLAFGVFYTLSLLPFRVLYCISDIAYLLVYRLLRYRREIVRKNLSTAFPDKNEAEIAHIERRFYHWFCDYTLEAIKLLSISDTELKHRFTIQNSQEIIECFDNGQSVAAILGHYCNWEWLSCVGMELPKESRCGLVYHPLSNHFFDELFRRIRSSQANGVPIPKQDTLRYLLAYKQQGINSFFGYISDQTPKWENIHLWLPFLNHDTPVFTGSERLMRKLNNAVYYVEMSRPRRGYYTCTYHLITKMPNELPEYEITRRFFELLEQTIRRNPEYYLWSHNRWKRTHEEYNKRMEGKQA